MVNNINFFKGAIQDFTKNHPDQVMARSKKDMCFTTCDDITCEECVFNEPTKSCATNKVLWFLEDYDDKGNLKEKMCSMCKQVKPVSEFMYRKCDKRYYSYCNDCKKIYEREYKKARREMDAESK